MERGASTDAAAALRELVEGQAERLNDSLAAGANPRVRAAAAASGAA